MNSYNEPTDQRETMEIIVSIRIAAQLPFKLDISCTSLAYIIFGTVNISDPISSL